MRLSRRTVLTLPFIGSVFAQSETLRLKLGAMELTFLSDGYFSLSFAYALPHLSAEEIAAFMLKEKADPKQQLMAMNIVLIKTGGDLCLIDCGGGSYLPTAGLLPKRLEALGIKPESITKIIFTHAHPDHLWGAIDEFDTPLFTQATHYLPPVERDYWQSGQAERETIDSLKAIAGGTARRLKLLTNLQTDASPAQGLRYVPAFGHTKGHCALFCESENQRLLLSADSFISPFFSFSHPQWELTMDNDKAQAVATRKKLLEWVAFEKILLHGYHLPSFGLGFVEKAGTAYKFITTNGF